jgi:4-hydroxybenzoate polyprenyltransferase
MSQAERARPIPLVVDVDGTLVRSDLLLECALQFAAHRPLQLWRPAVWLAGGKARLKAELAARAGLPVETLPLRFLLVLAAYVVATLAYSLLLKRRVLIDVVTLGGLYTLRVLGGVAAIAAPVSPWLLMFSLFLFLALAIVKRCSELVVLRKQGGEEAIGRGYLVDDLSVLFALGAAAGFGATLVIALYLNGTPEVQALYGHPARLWLLCPLLVYWISRMLLLANRDQLHDDPLVFALTDRNSWLCGALAALVVAAAI